MPIRNTSLRTGSERAQETKRHQIRNKGHHQMQLQAAYHFRDAARTSAGAPALPLTGGHPSGSHCPKEERIGWTDGFRGIKVCPWCLLVVVAPPVSGIGKVIVAKTALNPVTRPPSTMAAYHHP